MASDRNYCATFAQFKTNAVCAMTKITTANYTRCRAVITDVIRFEGGHFQEGSLPRYNKMLSVPV